MVEVRVLGTLQAVVGDSPITLPADARARELLGWLAVHPGRHPRSALAGRLRPDVAEESARKTLRDAVYKLRTALGPDGGSVLVAGREEVGLEGASVDLQDFRRLRRAGDLQSALAAASGELLPGIDADWAMRARDEHAAEVIACAAELAGEAEAAGDLPLALSWTRRRVELEPLGEAAHRDLIRLLALSDDRPAALRAATALSERLRRELGVPPSATTRALVDDIRAGRLGAGPVGEDQGQAQGPVPKLPTPPQPAARLPAPLARTVEPEGRAPVLDRLERSWADAVTGRLELALVAGEAGIGKTTLAGALARRVQADGGAVLYGRSEERALVPYQPWVELLESYLAGLPAGEAEHWLGLHDGALRRLLPARASTRNEAAGANEQYLAFEVVAGLLAHAVSAAPGLLVLDDLHWADEESLALLRHVVRSAEAAPLLILLCARGEELNPAATETLAGLRRQLPPNEVALAGLDVTAVAAILARRGAADHAARASAADYQSRTGGNPFFLDALLRDEPDGTAATAGPPPGVRDVVQRRLMRLGQGVQDLLALAAVVGLEFELPVVADACDQTLAAAMESLDGALTAGLVVPAGPPGRYAFAHALVSETLLGALPESRRARLHLQVADALEASTEAVGAGEVVRHLRAAGPLVEADRLAKGELGAAEEAGVRAAPNEAAEHYAAAVSALPLAPGHAEVLIGLGQARDRAGQREEARAAFASAASLAQQHGDASALARAALGFGGLAVVIAAADSATVELLEAALAATTPGDAAMVARLQARLAVELYYDDPERSRVFSDQALPAARESGEPAALTAALNARRVVLWGPGHAAQRLEIVDEMIRVAEASGDRTGVLQARNWRVVDLMELGRIAELHAEIDAYAALADEVGLPHYRWYVPLWRAWLAIGLGHWDEVAALQEHALALGALADDPNAPLLVEVQRDGIIAIQWRHADVDRDRVVASAAAAGDRDAWSGWIAQLDAYTGFGDRGAAIVERLTRDGCAALRMNANWLVGGELAEAIAELGDSSAAQSLYARLEPYADLYPVVARGACTENVTEHSLGRLAATMGRFDEAQARLQRAVTINDESGSPTHAVSSMLRLAQVQAAAGDREAAEATFAATITRAEQLAMPVLAAEARAARSVALA